MHENFGDDLNKFTIGVRRSDQVNRNPGPGQYSPEKADLLVMEKAA